jgi:hypothetical protein
METEIFMFPDTAYCITASTKLLQFSLYVYIGVGCFLQTPVLTPDGVGTVNFLGEIGTKITVKITKTNPNTPSTVSDVTVKACTEGEYLMERLLI